MAPDDAQRPARRRRRPLQRVERAHERRQHAPLLLGQPQHRLVHRELVDEPVAQLGQHRRLGRALKLAARSGHQAVAASLLDARACPNGGHTKKSRGQTPLMVAASAGHLSVAQLLPIDATLARAATTPNTPA